MRASEIEIVSCSLCKVNVECIVSVLYNPNITAGYTHFTYCKPFVKSKFLNLPMSFSVRSDASFSKQSRTTSRTIID